MTVRLAVFVTHPVQYHAPLWRGLAARPGLRTKLFYFSDHGVTDRVDPGFGTSFAWDAPLLEGYDHEFLARLPVEAAERAVIPDADRLLARERPDTVLIHGYTQPFARQLLRLKRARRYKLILWAEFSDEARRRGLLKRAARNLYLNWFYRHVDHFCPIGEAAKAHLVRRGVPEARMTVTPYSVDDWFFEAQRKSLDRDACRRELGLQPGQVAFLFSGKLIPRKQPLLLAEAARRLADRPDLALIVVGDGELRGEMERMLRPALGSRLIMPGFVNQGGLGRYYRAADAFVLPSTAETWGLVVNEAMHFGLPVVVSDGVGCRLDLVEDGRTGFVFGASDPDALARLMRRMIGEPALRAAMGEAAHARIQGFTAGRAVDALCGAIREAAPA